MSGGEFTVLIVPDSALVRGTGGGSEDHRLTLFSLTHPRTQTETLYAVSGSESKDQQDCNLLYEVNALDEDMASWTLGSDLVCGSSKRKCLG